MEAQMMIRLDPELKARIQKLARSEGKSASQLVRELIETHTRERDMGGFVNDLWGRIGKKMEEQRIGPDEINRAIRDVRKEKQ